MTTSGRPQSRHTHDTMPGFRAIQTAAFVVFAVLSVVLAMEVVQGAAEHGGIWLIPLVAIAAYLAADFVSGFVHFLADTFGTPDTPFVGKAFVLPFREHHDNPKGILEHPFMIANGNNCLVTVPFLIGVLVLVPVDGSRAGYLTGAFGLFFCLAILLTNQFHKWAHMDEPPRAVAWLQRKGLVLSKEHHDVHHVSPFDTYFCITVGWWNPLLERIRFFERVERMIRFVTASPRPEAQRTTTKST